MRAGLMVLDVVEVHGVCNSIILVEIFETVEQIAVVREPCLLVNWIASVVERRASTGAFHHVMDSVTWQKATNRSGFSVNFQGFAEACPMLE